MGINWLGLLRGVLGAMGVIRKSEKFDASDNANFLATRCAGEVGCIDAGTQALPNGIAEFEGRTEAHTFFIVTEAWANKMRVKYPELFAPLIAAGLVSKNAPANTIIEAEGAGIQENSMDKYMGSGQIIGMYRKLTDGQIETLLLWFYKQVGKPYGYLTFLTEIFDKPDDVPVTDPGWICSGLVCYGFWINFGWLLAKAGITPAKATPPQVVDGIEAQVLWSRDFWNRPATEQ